MERSLENQTREWAADRSEATGKDNADMASKFSHIKGWGIHADPEDQPNYPMKHYNGDDHKRLNYERPVQQVQTDEILHSNERPSVTAVFGTSVPLRGLSGKLRRHAFKYSEGNWNHWLTLLLADRVDMVEGIIEDVKGGRFPNMIAERGWTAEWKYNRPQLIRNAAIAGSILAGLWMLSSLSRKISRG